MSLAEIKTAVDALSPDELTELAAFIRERDNAAWDRQIDSDFSENGRLSSVAEEIRSDIRAGRPRGLSFSYNARTLAFSVSVFRILAFS